MFASVAGAIGPNASFGTKTKKDSTRTLSVAGPIIWGSRTERTTLEKEMSASERWLRHPESVWARKLFFHIHLWVGVGVGLYVLLMSISGSMIVYRNQLEKTSSIVSMVEWVVNFHENLLSGKTGRLVNGIGSLCLISLCLTGAIIWWPGISNWRRSLTVNWKANFGRVSWDLHSALGFWCFLFVLMWGVSGFYFCFPQAVNAISGFVDPNDKYADRILGWLSMTHFGRFGWFAEALWTLLGLVLAVLSVTGVFLCCHRMIYGSQRHHEANQE